jgi:hypothetical protein
MNNMDGWDFVLLTAAAYIAVTALARLMTRHRNQLLGELSRQANRQKQGQNDGSDDFQRKQSA